MLIDLTQDNLYVSLCSQKLRADKTGYIEILDDLARNGHVFQTLSAPRGLGVSTFLDMLNAFYGDRYQSLIFADTAVSRNAALMTRRGAFFELAFDFAEINATTGYNEIITRLCEETFRVMKTVFPGQGRHKTEYDFAKCLLAISRIAGKKLVITFKNFDRVQRYAIKQLNILTAWQRLFAQIQQLNLREDFIFLLVAGAHIPGMTELLVNPENPDRRLFFSLTEKNSPKADDMYGWCGITQEELTYILQGSMSDLDEGDLYDWCGHYGQALMRPASVFASIAEHDFIMTVNIDSGLWYIRDILEAGYGSFLLCGEIGVARLLNGESVSMHQLSECDSRKSTQYAAEIYSFTRRFLNMLSGEGLITVTGQFGGKLDNAEIANRETQLSVSDALSEDSGSYVSQLCRIAAGRTRLAEAFAAGEARSFADLLVSYLNFKRAFLNRNAALRISIWQGIYDLLTDLDGYELRAVNDAFVLRDLNADDSYLLICVAVNADMAALINGVVNIRLTSSRARRALDGYKGRLEAFVYQLTISPDTSIPVKAECQKALVV
ncbi:AAA family ATPase [Succinimonas sp.]|uniref:AAA family ATPase n=1 Tax=Succinimonas sp. TaxID=1936151 RepID=UPI003869F711